MALSNSRLERFAKGQVTFRYRDNRSQQLHQVTLTVEEFIHRFLQHTLPRSFAKVRYYGLFSPAARTQLEQARTLLTVTAVTPVAHTSQSPSSLAVSSRATDSRDLSLLSPRPTPITRPLTAATTPPTKGPAMTLTCSPLTQVTLHRPRPRSLARRSLLLCLRLLFVRKGDSARD